MKLQFNLEYHTTFGEELVLNILSDKKVEQHKMSTPDGLHWTCELNKTMKASVYMDYYYSVYRGDQETRHEWLTEPHRLEFSAIRGIRYTIYDHWIDIPEDSYMYSSAITECVAARKCKMSEQQEYGRTVRLKVRAPQLRGNERLAILGGGEALGNWEAKRALDMTEHESNEWVVSLNADKLPQTFEFKFVALDEKVDVTPLWENGANRTVALPDIELGEVVVYELSQVYFPVYPWKAAGTVIPIFSLRSEGSFGVGDFGDLKLMVDWCDKTKQRVLQVLPITDTNMTHTWQDSYPYNSISIYALHPQYTDFRQLPPLKDEAKRQAFEALRQELNALPQIDYERMFSAKIDYLREIFAQEWATVQRRESYKKFFEQNKEWLVPYAAFCYFRDLYGTATFSEWPKNATLQSTQKSTFKGKKELQFWYFVQYNLDAQMREAHAYARAHRVILKGDIPIGISRDGVEAWVEPKYFNLNGQAGAPPDAFAEDGQLIRKLHVLRGAVGMTQDEYESLLGSYGVESSKELDEWQLEKLVEFLSKQTDNERRDLDVQRKRLLAAVCAFCEDTVGKWEVMDDKARIWYAKGVACRAAGMEACDNKGRDNFNRMSLERLKSLTYAFQKRKRDMDGVIDAIKTINQ